MVKLLIAGPIDESGLHLARSHKDFDICYIEEGSNTAYLKYLKDADALLLRTQPLMRQDIEQAPNLKIVSRHGVGFDAVDKEALSKRNIPLTIVGDVNSRSVAEHAIMLILASVRRVVEFDSKVKNNQWQQRNIIQSDEAYGKTLGIIGYGRIGRYVGQMALALGMDILVYDAFQKDKVTNSQGIKFVDDLPSLLNNADIVTLHIPASNHGYLINQAELNMMKTGAILINTARGGVVDEQALVEALASGKIGAVGLDVLENEPPKEPSPLYSYERVIITPHTAALTKPTMRRMATKSVQNIIDYYNGCLNHDLIVNKADIKL